MLAGFTEMVPKSKYLRKNWKSNRVPAAYWV